MVWVAVAMLLVFVPLSVEFIRDGKALKELEKEVRKLDRIKEIEDKYGITISDESLKMN